VEETATSQQAAVPIKVIARVRPQIPNELRHPVCIEVVDDSIVNGQKTQIVVRQGITSSKSEQKIYSFEKVLDPESTQSQVFQEVDGRMLCNAFLNGQNCTIFVYGPTSTGKTFTMQGNVEDIIHSYFKSNQVSLNASPDQSNISQCDESIMTNDLELRNFTPTKHTKLGSSAKKRFGNSFLQNSRISELSPGGRTGGSKLPMVSKIARDMMVDSQHKGII